MFDDISEGLIGTSTIVQQLRDEVVRAARSDAKVLITGESGAGKEVIAHLIHRDSRRSGARFVAMNCAAVPDSLLESELFGHVRGSFTGAVRDKAGLLESANGGTVFMDEIGETTLRMQALLLRFLENGEISRVGSDRPQARTDVRVISATNRDLPDLIERGQFRNDLYYRLDVLHVHVPSLRERREDVPLFLKHFCRLYAFRHRLAPVELSAPALDALVAYNWPGNVRELKNVVERLALANTVGPLDLADLPAEVLGRARRAAGPVAASGAPTVRPIVGELIERMTVNGESFWSAVYPLFVARDLTREELRMIISDGLRQTQGSYRAVVQLFNMPPADYKRFLNVLRKHQCHVPWIQFRYAGARRATAAIA
ncbi:MAG TPA: sigma-54 dependent transcriptional regulator [Vicinamibacterales bacterium]|nr:sigma-54 dependent transcriptional regulator [Vicinamibacterales bacterium]